MFKKLDLLIIRAFIGPFVATFFITFFVLMMQNLWKYIDDLVGKDLELIIIGKFVLFAGATFLTLAMPIAILISSIMTFGNLGESFELVAIKSSGISLLRFMRPLMFVSLLLCIITFLFANYVIPYATLKFKTLYYDILYKKPALDLKEGTFYTHIPGYAIKVAKKEKTGNKLTDVIIYEQQPQPQDNAIVAKRGVMTLSPDKQFLEFTLYDGTRYQERGTSMDTTTEFIRVGFKEYRKLFDVRSFQLMNTNDSFFRNDQKMLTVVQLDKAIDTLKRTRDTVLQKFRREWKSQLRYMPLPDSVWAKVPAAQPLTGKSFRQLLPDSARMYVMNSGISLVNGLRNTQQFAGSDYESKTKDIRLNEMEWHRKFSLSLACLVLFFIGAPLGSIIRKGGLGMPLVVAIVFFLLFHLLYVFGEKFVKEGVASPFFGMWLSVLVLTPIGIFLTYKAMHDSQLFNKEFYTRFIARWRRKKNAPAPDTTPQTTSEASTDSSEVENKA